MKQVQTYRFQLDDELFAPKLAQTGSDCFCTRSPNDTQICGRDGVFDLSGCAEGAPLVLSGPHFLHTGRQFLGDVEGLRPIEPIHETYMDIEPVRTDFHRGYFEFR